MLNPYFAQRAIPSEHNLYDSLIAESIQIKGFEVYYLPRTLTKLDKIFGEDTLSQFNHAIPIEMFMDTQQTGPDGAGDIITKFGLEIQDQTSFTVSKKRWDEVVGALNLTIVGGRPNEGDLIFLQIQDLQRELYTIDFVEHEDPFYQLEGIHAYKLKCSMFMYSNERFATGVPIIDEMNNKTSFDALLYKIKLEDSTGTIKMESGDSIIQDDWVMEDAQREYASNRDFMEAAAPITNFEESFGFQ